jgi:hypothetical protein
MEEILREGWDDFHTYRFDESKIYLVLEGYSQELGCDYNFFFFVSFKVSLDGIPLGFEIIDKDTISMLWPESEKVIFKRK